MARCVFCSKDLQPGEIVHNNPECNTEKEKVNAFLNNDNRITVGLAACGISAGGLKTFEALKNANLGMPVERVGCQGMCYEEPIVTVRIDGKFFIYGNLTEDKVSGLVAAIKERRKFDECFIAEKNEDIDYYKKQVRIIMKRAGKISPLDLKQYIIMGGFDGLKKAMKMSPEEVIKTVLDSGLRGRGGAGFPTGKKWGLFAPNKGKKFLIVNGDEGDPGAFMNRTVTASDPFSMLEGLIIAGYATGAEESIIYARAEYPLAIDTLNEAIDILNRQGFIGENILGKQGFNFKIRIMMGAGAFVCGEETALMKSIEGERGHPMPRPPYPAQKGVWGYPSNINNVETYCHVTNILSMGVDEYKKNGSPNNSGTKCICLTGKIKRSGVIEVPLGMTFRTLIFEVGGGIRDDKKFKAVQSGGPSGGCVAEWELDTPLDYDNVPKLGTIMGSGGLVVMDENDCMVSVAKFFLNFTTEESCGKCVPCREGTMRMWEMVNDISKGVATEDQIDKLRHLAATIADTSLCALGQTAPNPVLSTINKFRDEYLMHIRDKKCPTHRCEALISYIIQDKCVGCTACARNCPVQCITGEPKHKHLIDQARCIKCGKCYEVCAFKAINKE